ncbi:hypothetical protein ACFYNV_18625 [Streptomyces albidoflavus]
MNSSDLFVALGPEDRFDLVYWNSNFAEPPEGVVNETALHHAFFDPGYDAHRRFLREAPGPAEPRRTRPPRLQQHRRRRCAARTGGGIGTEASGVKGEKWTRW